MILYNKSIIIFLFCLILFSKYLNYFINILVKLTINFKADNFFMEQLFFCPLQYSKLSQQLLPSKGQKIKRQKDKR